MIARARFGWKLGMMIVVLALAAVRVAAQQAEETRLDSLGRRVRAVQRHVDHVDSQVDSLNDQFGEFRKSSASDSSNGMLFPFLIGVFCALWAQNTGRNPWLWFFLGVFFDWITLLVLLAKNAGDRASLPPPSAAPVPLPASAG
jgi:hypothetical protein